MIENILKLRAGKRVSRNEYAQAKADYDLAYQNADDDTKAKIDGLMQSSINYSSANPMNNRSAREYLTQMYRNAVAIMNGDDVPGFSAVGSTPNYFNGYSHDENYNNANNVTARYMSHAKGSSLNTVSAEQGSLSTTPKYYRYNWGKGLDSDWASMMQGDSLELRSNSFISTLRSNIDAALKSGKELVGATKEDLLQALSAIDSGSWKGSSTANWKALLGIAMKAGVDPKSFEAYFDGLIPGDSKSEKNKKARVDEGWEFIENGDYGDVLNQKIAQNGWLVGKKDGKTYFFDKNYSGPITDQSGVFIDTDWRNEGTTLGHGWAIDKDGSFVYGDLNPYLKDTQSTWNPLLTRYITGLKNTDRWATNGNLFNIYTSWSDNTANSDLIDKHAHSLSGKDVADVSSYFNGADVIATVKGNNFKLHETDFGHLKLDNKDFTFYWLDSQGEPRKGTFEDAIKAHGNINLGYESFNKGLSSYLDSSSNLANLQWNIDLSESDYDINTYGDTKNWFTPGHYYNNPWDTNEVTAGDTSMFGSHSKFGSLGTVLNSPEKFARLMLATFMERERLSKSRYNDDKELLRTLDVWMTKHPEELLRTIDKVRLAGGLDKDPRYARAFVALQRTLHQTLSRAGSSSSQGIEELNIPSNKEGGILKAALGTGLDVDGNPMEPKKQLGSIASGIRNKVNSENQKLNKTIANAEKSGRDIMRQRAIDQNQWTTSDTLRATALATDIAGLIAAAAGPATGGVGSVVAVGSGVASMVQDAIADFSDDKVSKGEAWRNIGINTGLAAAAFVGAKAPKIVSKAILIVPKAMMYLGAAGLAFDSEVHESVGKLTSGKNLNTNDWKNLSMVLRTLTGIGTVHTMSYKQRKGQKIYEDEVAKNIKNLKVDSTLNKDYTYVQNSKGEPVPIKKSEYEAVQKALKEDKIDEAKAALIGTDENPGTYKNNPDAVDDIIITLKGEKTGIGKLAFWKDAPEGKQALVDATPEQLKDIEVPADVAAEARILAVKALRKKAQTSHRSKRLNDLESREWVEAFNPTLGAALNNAQTRGKGYKTIRDLIAGESEEIGPIAPSKAKKLISPDSQQAKSISLSVREAMTAESERLRSDLGQREASKKYKQLQNKANIDKKELDVREKTLKNAEDRVNEIDARIKESESKFEEIRQKYKEYFFTKNGTPRNKLEGPAPEEAIRAQAEIDDLRRQHALALEIAEEFRVPRNLQKNISDFRLRKAEESYQVLSDINSKIESKMDKSRTRELAKGKALGNTKKTISVTVDGKEVKVPKGTKATSYTHIKDPDEAEKVAKFGRNNMKTLPESEAKKLLPSNAKFRGAAVDTQTGELVVWQQGGKINEKYSHLRK